MMLQITLLNKKRGLCLMKCPRETVQNLPYFLKYKNPCNHGNNYSLTHFYPNECPGLYRYIPGYSLGKKLY